MPPAYSIHLALDYVPDHRRALCCSLGLHYVHNDGPNRCYCGQHYHDPAHPKWNWRRKMMRDHRRKLGVRDKPEHSYRGDVSQPEAESPITQKHERGTKMSEVLAKWKTSSGIIDHFSMLIDRATWGYNEKYQDGEALLLTLEGKSDEDGEEQRVELPCGKGWAKKDKAGRYAENPDNPKADFNDRSFVGKLIDVAILDTDKVNEDGIHGFGISELLGKRGLLPTDAHAWKGMRLEFKRTRFNFGTRKVPQDNGTVTLVPIETERLFPVAFLGCEGEEGWESGAPGKKAAAKTKADTKPASKKATAKTKVVEEADDEAPATPGEVAAEEATPEPPKETAAAKLRRERAEKQAAEAASAAAETDMGPITRSLSEQYPSEMDIVKGLAAKHDDHEDFLEACMANPTLEPNDDIIMACGDKKLLWTELKG